MSNLFQTLKQLISQGVEGYFAIKYAEFARDSEEMQKEYRRLAENVVSMFQKGKLLEVGPGPSYISIEIAKRLQDVEIIGLEISDTMIEMSNINAREHGVSEKITLKNII